MAEYWKRRASLVGTAKPADRGISGRGGRRLMQHAAMPLTREELDDLSASTLAHYNTRADEYWQGTRDHDVSQNIATLLRHIASAAPASRRKGGRVLRESAAWPHVASSARHCVGRHTGSAGFAALARLAGVPKLNHAQQT